MRNLVFRMAGFLETRFPDPYVFALALSLLAFAFAWGGTPHGVLALATFWARGFSGIFTFTTQMALILVTGYALALSPPVDRLLNRMADFPRTLSGAVWFVGLISGIASWLQWGLGLVVAGLLSTRVARRRAFPLAPLAAAGYTGFLVWHSGLSGSIPLTIATHGLAQNEVERVFGQAVPVSETVFAWWNLVPAAVVLVASLAGLVWLVKHAPPRENDAGSLSSEEETWPPTSPVGTVLQGLLVAIGVLFLVAHFSRGKGLDLNVVILIFLLMGMLAHGSAERYARAVGKATPSVAGILLQFPLYGGIQGLLIHSGLGDMLARGVARITPPALFYGVQFLLAGVVNLFVPSGGGQWVIQGPVAMEAARRLGVDPVVSAMAVAWGDAWTNMLQPFWALPVLGITGLSARKLVAHTFVPLLVAGMLWLSWCIALGVWR